jgi:hypothetical protein
MALGLLIIIGIKEGLKIVFLMFFTYTLFVIFNGFVGFGLYPMLFKKLRF